MKASLTVSYVPTGDGGVTVKVGFVGSDTYIVALPLDRQGVCNMAASLLVHSGVTEAEFSDNQMRPR